MNKLIRALEVILVEQQPLVMAHRKQRNRLEGFRILKLGLNPVRTELRKRIDYRSRLMFEKGLIEEVRELRNQGYGAEAKAMESVGYRQAQALLDGRCSEAEAIADTTLRTAQYAKRQMTWFRRDAEVVWLDGFGEDPAVQSLSESVLTKFLF